eukprot:TRINITY_DN106081_c0_g1_i1.p2 TRINITY_DN106081_c0_g1~~TRINITY_DN106081_c0_g1_i1.p2  ORF type:complete len:111 (-),score=9.18 TRINITY_DN106081_c0_g1_i1:370-702(-)
MSTTTTSGRRELHTLSVVLCMIISIHAAVWAAVNAFLFFINLVTTMLVPPWFVFPLLGWGFGLLVNTSVFVVILYAKGLEDDISLFVSKAASVVRRMRSDAVRIVHGAQQ